MTFDEIEVTFARLYNELRDTSESNVPSSFTWIARTIKELEAERGDEEGRFSDWVDGRLFDEIGTGNTVAWIYECEGRALMAIGETATADQVEDVLRSCLNLVDEPGYNHID